MKKRNFLIWILVILYVCWIFSNSLTIGELSGKASSKVANFLIQYVNRAGFTIEFARFHHYVRKLAHLSEYALLGFLIVIAIRVAPLLKSHFLNFVIMMAGIPLIDEGLQRFIPGRSGAFVDSFIDMTGILLGAFVGYVFVLIILDLTKGFRKKTAE